MDNAPEWTMMLDEAFSCGAACNGKDRTPSHAVSVSTAVKAASDEVNRNLDMQTSFSNEATRFCKCRFLKNGDAGARSKPARDAARASNDSRYCSREFKMATTSRSTASSRANWISAIIHHIAGWNQKIE